VIAAVEITGLAADDSSVRCDGVIRAQ
jgi:hypothetical protein